MPDLVLPEESRYHSCEHCRRVVVSNLTAVQGEIELPHSRSEGRAARKAGCPLFAIFQDELFQEISTRSLVPSAVKAWVTGDTAARRPFRIAYQSALKSTSPTYNEELKFPLLISADADDPAAAEIATRPLRGHPELPLVASFLRSQLVRCLQQHVPNGSCPPVKSSFVPRRLMRIQGCIGNPHLRLVEHAGGHARTAGPTEASEVESSNVRWLALSYCWGGDQPYKTVTANLTQRLGGFLVTDLPRTIQDTVTVCQYLDIPYAWIDSICIVQDDDNEKALDLATMAEVYSKAFLTLSASRASSAREGFLNKHDIKFPFEPFRLRYICSPRNEIDWNGGNIAFRNGEQDGQEALEGSILIQPDIRLPPSPVNSRAWTMQERVLSPRLVEFTSLNVHWRCPACRASDTGRPEGSFRSPSDYVNSRQYGKMGWDWHLLVEDYSRRDLTYPADRLVALSAVATQVGSSTDYRSVEYLAGLWSNSLEHDLFWQRRYGDNLDQSLKPPTPSLAPLPLLSRSLSRSRSRSRSRSPAPPLSPVSPQASTRSVNRPRDATYRAPSWSWASIDDPIFWPLDGLRIRGAPAYGYTAPSFEIHRAGVTPLNRNLPYGSARSGDLLVTAQLWPCSVYCGRPVVEDCFGRPTAGPGALKVRFSDNRQAATAVLDVVEKPLPPEAGGRRNSTGNDEGLVISAWCLYNLVVQGPSSLETIPRFAVGLLLLDDEGPGHVIERPNRRSKGNGGELIRYQLEDLGETVDIAPVARLRRIGVWMSKETQLPEDRTEMVVRLV